MLQLNELRFAYPGDLKSYRFGAEIAAGRILAVTGPSGCGKSTLLNLVAGFERPRSGTIELEGKDIAQLPPDQRPVSILFQADNLFEHLTAGANLGLALRHRSKTTHSQRIEQALADVDLAGFSAHKADTLSGGQKQRIALARTLLLDRPVLLLDEPFAALDLSNADKLRELVARLVREQNWHTILVSHDPRDLAIADQHLTMRDGRLLPGPKPGQPDYPI